MTAFVPQQSKITAVRHAWMEAREMLYAASVTHQYGVPMKESLL